MNINLTLLVQIGHFCFAYVIISKLLIKPAYNLLQSERSKILKLKQQISYEQEVLAVSQDYKLQTWQECQRYFHSYRPNIDTKTLMTVNAYNIIIDKVDGLVTPARLNLLAGEVASALKKKVVHD